MTLWANRMGTAPADALMAFTASLSFDKRLAASDIRGSIAHVHGLLRAKIITEDEAEALVGALEQVGVEQANDSFVYLGSDEDIHTAIERRVTELVPDIGAKLHTGRSRNDQVATALRLFARSELARVVAYLLELQRTLERRATEVGDAFMPGYTHMQRAQPVLLAHHLLAHGWALSRDIDRVFATWRRLDVSPLGAGALAGSSLGIDPDQVAEELGFHARFENSLDAVSDRDFVAEILFDLALVAIHLSRIGEEIVMFSSEEFGFVRLDDAWATGSSMLPQKKNPDVAELARGKAGRLVGHLTGFLTTLKGLPLSYNRDLQEDKEPLFDALDQVVLALVGLDGLIGTASFDLERMQAAASGAGLAAVDLAEWLVAGGLAFRDAHGLVGTLVRESIERGVPLGELVEAHPDFGDQALEVLDAAAALRRRTTPGGTGPDAVAVQLERFRRRVAADAARLSEREV
ncbi:MAG: argininosuccinate lyase [Acidimicrobiales bacterium]